MKGQSVRAAASVISPSAETTFLTGIPAASGNETASIDQVITGVINLSAGTGTTAVVIRCRNSSAVQVGVSQSVTLAAGNTASIPFCFNDSSGASSTTYSVTVQQTGGTGAGTTVEAVGYCIGEG